MSLPIVNMIFVWSFVHGLLYYWRHTDTLSDVCFCHAEARTGHSVPTDCNGELRTNLSTKYGTLLSQVEYKATDGDVWWQDPFEIGYVQSPYGSQYVILALPRSTVNSGRKPEGIPV